MPFKHPFYPKHEDKRSPLEQIVSTATMLIIFYVIMVIIGIIVMASGTFIQHYFFR